MTEIRLGIIGLSEGNGHPYSWSAICNGYDSEAMAACPFPVIPQYLARRKWPDDKLPDVRVTHIWTQDRAVSADVARAARIATVADRMEDMIGAVDAVLLARDDPENHESMSAPFIDAGLPVYIDKPLATDRATAQRILGRQRYPGQVFSCSAFRYASELACDLAHLGPIRQIHATVIKDWAKYSVHVIDPVLGLIGSQGAIVRHQAWRHDDSVSLSVAWESGTQATFCTTGKRVVAPIAIRLLGEHGWRDFLITDTFSAFRSALAAFLQGVRTRQPVLAEDAMLSVVDVIEAGQPG